VVEDSKPLKSLEILALGAFLWRCYNSRVNLSIAIVGLPNVGKSTLFNALLKRQVAEAANYPFCTIEPNVGVVEVPDERLGQLADIVARVGSGSGSGTARPPIVPAVVKFVDVAGLVKGAAQGEGLGNQFLSHIRECQMILEVVRDFTDENVVRAGAVSPEEDRATIKTELILKDIETVSKVVNKKVSSTASKGEKFRLTVAEKLLAVLNTGLAANEAGLSSEELEVAQEWQLLTLKPTVHVYNVNEATLSHLHPSPLRFDSWQRSRKSGKDLVLVSAKVEAELAALSPEDQKEFMAGLGLTESGLDRVIRVCYQTLGLQTYFTAGPKEVRAWTIKKGDKAPQAAGAIHTDFERGFIAVEVCHYQDYIDCGGWQAAKEKGKVRLEGKEYVLQDGDVVEFRFSV
jgi:GTP-binding protein YchF